jgi:hypothetical protein
MNIQENVDLFLRGLQFNEVKTSNTPKIAKHIRTFPKFSVQKSKCPSGQTLKLRLSFYITKYFLIPKLFQACMCINMSNYNINFTIGTS